MTVPLPVPLVSDPQNQQNFERLAQLVSEASGAGSPPGAMTAYAGSTAPDGWLLCDGSAVSRTTYARLFTVISTTYGAGDGSTTFTLPDLRGRIPVGKGTHTEVDALGDSDGLAVGSRKIKHRHGKGTISASGGAHAHLPTTGFFLQEDGGGDRAITGGVGTNRIGQTASATHSHPTSEFSGEVGDTTGPLDGPAYLVLNWLIKA